MQTYIIYDNSILKFRELEIGDLVTWNVSGKIRRGIFKQVLNDNAEINTTFIESQPINIKCFVPLEIIQLDNSCHHIPTYKKEQ